VIFGVHSVLLLLTVPSIFLTIVDDYSRCVWIYLMKQKSEATDYLIMFCNMAKTQHKLVVKQIRSDNGREFFSDSILAFIKQNGMLCQKSCVDTLQQNGVVESKHRHLLEVAKALRIQAGLPKRFWGECVLTTSYLVNLTPTPILSSNIPYEILFRRPPNYDHL